MTRSGSRWVWWSAVVLALSGCVPAAAPPVAAPAPSTNAEKACAELARAGIWRGTATGDAGQVSVDADDAGFAPTCLEAEAGRALTVVVTNRGRLPHTFSVPGVNTRESIDAGQTVFIHLPAITRPLRVICEYHTEANMFAAIVPIPHV